MITYLNKLNALQYHILFDKATKLLQTVQPSELSLSFPSGFDWSDFSIGTLNEYFGYLDYILKAAAGNNNDLNTDAAHFYLRLPLDEEVLAINADTRTISVPRSFATTGIGVLGDELAETLYFTIDRFFDYKDLANNDMQIAIQWEIRQGGATVQGISRNFGKDIETLPGKIIFGWNIGSELTQEPGTITFAVRFYEVNSETHKFTYSLTTLPATVVIQSSLNFDVINNVIIDRSGDITSNIHTSGIYDMGIPLPSEPIITSELKIVSPVPDMTAPRIIDLENGQALLSVGAQPSDNGVITYDWKSRLYNIDNQDYESSWSSSAINATAQNDYVEVTTSLDPSITYYIKDAESNPATYSALNIGLLEEPYTYRSNEITIPPEEEGDEPTTTYEYGYLKKDSISDLITVYEKVNVATVTAAGKYTVDINARTLVNTTTKHLDDSLTITVPAPLAPVITLPDNYNITGEGANQEVHFVLNDNSSVLELTPQSMLGEAADGIDHASVGDYEGKISSSYKWQKRSGESSWNDVTEDGVDGPVIKAAFEEFLEFDKDTNQLTVKGLSSDAATAEDFYHFVATSVRNGVSKSVNSAPYRITKAPAKPAVGFLENNNFIELNYQSTNASKTYNFIPGKQYSVDINPNLVSEKLTYIWMKTNIELEDEIANIVDLPNMNGNLSTIEGYEIAKIKDALLANEIDSDNPEYYNPSNGNDTIIASGAVDKTTLIQGQVFETSFTCTDTGNYYCIVINEVNNHIAINVSPYLVIVN